MTRELAVIHARENIRVNALCPGPLRTELLMKFLDTEAKKQRRLVHIPMGRFGEAQARWRSAALFLASDESSFMTGAAFLVDGGITAAYVTPEQARCDRTREQHTVSPVDGSRVRHPTARRRDRHRRHARHRGDPQRTWREVPLGERVATCRRMVAWMVDHAETIAEELAWQMGRPVRSTARRRSGAASRSERATWSPSRPSALADTVIEPKPRASSGSSDASRWASCSSSRRGTTPTSRR